MKKPIELEICPKCKHKEMIMETDGYKYCKKHRIICPNCLTGQIVDYATEAEAEAAWNTRQPRFSPEEREALRELIDSGIYQSNCFIRNAGDYENYKRKSIGISIETVRAMLQEGEK